MHGYFNLALSPERELGNLPRSQRRRNSLPPTPLSPERREVPRMSRRLSLPGTPSPRLLRKLMHSSDKETSSDHSADQLSATNEVSILPWSSEDLETITSHQLVALLNAIFKCSMELNLQSAANKICREMCNTFKVSVVELFLVDHEHNLLIPATRQNDSFHIGEGVAGFVAYKHQMLSLDHASEDFRFDMKIDGAGCHRVETLLALPIMCPVQMDRVVGVLELKNMLCDMEKLQEMLATIVAAYVGIAISHCQQFSKVSSQRNKYGEMLEVAKELNDIADVSNLVRTIIERAQQVMAADRCSLFIVDSENEELWSTYSGGNGVIRFPITTGVAGHTAVTGLTVNIANAYQDRRFNRSIDQKTGYHTKSILCMPVRDRDGVVIAVVQMINKLRDTCADDTDDENRLDGMTPTVFDKEDEHMLGAFTGLAAVALQNAFLYEEQEKAKAESETLLRLLKAVSSDMPLTDIIQVMMVHARELMDSDRCSFFLVDQEAAELWTSYAHGVDEVLRFPISTGVAGHVACTGEVINTSDAYSHPLFNKAIDAETKYKTQSILCHPVYEQNEIVAVIQMINKRSGHFSRHDERVLQTLCGVATIILHDSRVYRTIAEEKAKWQTFVEVLVGLGDKEIEKHMNTVVHCVRQVLNSDRGSLFIVDHVNAELFSKIAHGLDSLTDIRVPINTGIAGHVARTAETANVHNAYEDERFNKTVDVQTGYKTHNLLCAPIKNNEDSVIGVIQVLNKRDGTAYTQADEHLLEAFAALLAVQLQRQAREYADIGELASGVRLEHERRRLSLQSISSAGGGSRRSSVVSLASLHSEASAVSDFSVQFGEDVDPPTEEAWHGCGRCCSPVQPTMAESSTDVESINYGALQNKLLQEAQSSFDSRSFQREVRAKWVLTAGGGMLVGCAVWGQAQLMTWLHGTRIASTLALVDAGRTWTAFLTFCLLSALYAAAAAMLVLWVSPSACGSGLAEVKSYLNGIQQPHVLSIKTLVIKWMALVLTGASGLVAGQAAPMVHIGAATGSLIAEVSSRSVTSQTANFSGRGRLSLDFVGSMAAAGLAACLDCPVAAVLFLLEELCTLWSKQLLLRSFCSCASAVLMVRMLCTHLCKQCGGCEGLLLEGTQEGAWQSLPWELPIFGLLGVAGGLFGALFNSACVWLRYRRWQHLHIHGAVARLVEVCTLTLVSSSSLYLLSMAVGCQPLKDEAPTALQRHALQLDCPAGHWNELASLGMQLPQHTLAILLYGGGTSAFTPTCLVVFWCWYFVCMVLTHGTAMSGGSLTPHMISGATMGTLLSIAVRQLTAAAVQPSLYALLGAGAMLGGFSRVTLSFVVMLMELAGTSAPLLPLLVVVCTSKLVGDGLATPFYSAYLIMIGMPFLQEDDTSQPELATLTAEDVMQTDVTVLSNLERGSVIHQVLLNSTHNGFPVVDHGTTGERAFLSGIILRQQLCALLHHLSQVSIESSHGADPLTSLDLQQMLECNIRADQMSLSSSQRHSLLDLRPYVDSSVPTVTQNTPLGRVTSLFRLLALRHLVVVDCHNEVVGIITRKNLVPQALAEALHTKQLVQHQLANLN